MTIGDDVAKQQNLGYNSLEELKRSAGFNADARKSLLSRNLTVEKLMKSVENLRRQARSERENNGLETAYTYLFRIGEICDIITRDHPVFSKTRFEGSPDARRLHRIFAQSFAELEKIQTEISELYKKKASARVLVADIVEVSAHPTNGKTKEQKEQSSSVISPRDLVRLVETESKLALIVDFREDRSEIVKFKKESQIAVAEIPKSCLENAYTFQLVVTALPVGSSSRMLLNKLSMFDLIVLLDSGSDADPVDVNGKIIRNSPSGILSAALYDYNNLHLPKAPPLYLKGGFANWRMSYPVYVASADGSVRKASQFGAGESDIERAIQNLRKFRRVTVDYPDLYYKPPPPREPSPVEPLEEYSPVHPVELPETSVPTNEDRMELRASPVPIQPTPTISSSLNDSVARQIPQRPDQPIPRQMPIVDRSVKPKPLEHEYSSHPAPVDRNGKDAAPQGVARSDVSTFPSISSSSIAPSARSALVVPPQRPTVDRTTKEAVERKEAEFRREILSMYDACVENLRMKSRRGHVKPGHTGLVNIVNTCFMNTTLQALANTVPLRTLFCKKNFTRIINRDSKMGSQGVISAAFTALMDTMWSGEFVAVQPEAFRAVFADVVNEFLANGQQHDAAEFENILIDALYEDTNVVNHPKLMELPEFTGENIRADAAQYESISKQFADSPINQIFNLQTVSPKRCPSCRKQTVVFGGMLFIALDLRNDGQPTTLEECLERYFSTEEVEVECSNCKIRRRMMRHTKMWKLPKVLVIQLKRFGEMGNHYVKKDNNVRFGKQLSVKPFLHDQADDSQSLYTLYSVTNHVGNLNSGHYYAHVKNGDQWLEFNDEAVRPVSEDSVQTKAAFVLYYTNQPDRR